MAKNDERAILRNSEGIQIKILKIKNTDEKIKYNNKTYIINREIKPIIVKRLFKKYKYYVYTLDNPMPHSFNQRLSHLDAEQFNTLMETKVLYDLNRLKKGFNINWKYLLLGIGVLIVIYLVASGKFP